ncbi:hypothetical protein BJY16_008758 [Actinoplanes octamycinicus]|uniref:Uncharacterized protein n=1 Tax=Actinoplanes octamycinicus TaxID=135948 RepID=A0A7W7H7D1_9ACTN|nr:hypothetical protein [Actinoplanes octamycinicus]MBB4745299.1 hypothetical protein [Actinoplanes octamycinicus]GIE62222.1 hypothetical protein Aoc01nite_76240 [Actinoplanes octamycinicus]
MSSIELLIYPPDSVKGTYPPDAVTGGADPAPAPDPAAELRLFGLPQPLRQDDLERWGFEVEARPLRSYPLRHSSAGTIRPEYHTVVHATAGPLPRHLQAYGLGLMFPPHTVHAPDSTTAGDDCPLTAADHVHLRRAELAADDPLRSDRVRQILGWAKLGQDNSGVVRVLRAALADQVDKRAAAACATSTHQAEMVMLGDDALTRLDSRFVVERTILPAGALLADDQELAHQYVELVSGAPDDPAALAGFLGDLVAFAAGTTGENLLGYADGLPDQRAALLGLFGLVTVDPSTSLMVLTAAGPAPDRA